jgi:hypothetical protein
MRFRAKVTVVALAMMPVLLTQTPAAALPCDNTRWCAQYSGSAGGAQIAASSPLSSAEQPWQGRKVCGHHASSTQNLDRVQ